MSNDVDPVSEPAQEISAFYYTAANHSILLESDIKTEIVEQLTIFPMPHAPAWCTGMVSLRGKIIPVLDMTYMLKAEQDTESRWLLILESTPLPQIAIKIDRLPARLNYTEDNIESINKDQYPSWLIKLVKTDELTLLKADHGALFQQLIDENLIEPAQNTETNNNQDSLEDDA